MTNWTTGAVVALGIGLGAAFAASMGPAGYALGLAVALAILGMRTFARRDDR